MDLILSQLQLTQVRACLSTEQQKAQWQKELNDWFDGYETILRKGEYIVEERPIQIGCEDFNKTFGTNLKY
jgi:hypothetical protein